MTLKTILTLLFTLIVLPKYAISAQGPLSVHVLDNEFGGNAVNMTCILYRLEGNDFVELSTRKTDSVGRIQEFLPLEDYLPGTYRIWFDAKGYYNGRNIFTFFPAVQITYDVTDPLVDYHIPLVLSPHGFNTYRGS